MIIGSSWTPGSANITFIQLDISDHNGLNLDIGLRHQCRDPFISYKGQKQLNHANSNITRRKLEK